MRPASRSALYAQALSCWNWKCALLSATARSLVYLAAMARTGSNGRLAVVVVEIAYVTLTAGLYAGLQQKALGFRSRLLGNLTIAFAVPGLRSCSIGLPIAPQEPLHPQEPLLAVCIFTAVSALFHLYVMRRGVFLSGRGCSLLDDFRRIPRLIAGFVVRPIIVISALSLRLVRTIESQTAL